MPYYIEETLDIFPFKGIELQATFYRPNRADYQATILYFHGGGLISGHRNDLPKTYIDLLTRAGIGIVSVDYPLAPETKMPTILSTTFQITDWFVHDFLTQLGQDQYFIFGRSAGAFLALSNAVHINQFSNRPLGIITLYGYFNLNDASFSVPSRYYLKYPKISDKIITSLIKKEPTLSKDVQKRYPIYLAARQKGNWMNLLLSSPDQKQKMSISKEKLKTLPRLFISAATEDPDVPTRQSRQLADIHPDATLYLFKVDEHDFDRTHESEFGISLYKKMVAWILEILS